MQKVRQKMTENYSISGTFYSHYGKYFSPFLHSTSTLSVSEIYLSLTSGLAIFGQTFTDFAILDNIYKK